MTDALGRQINGTLQQLQQAMLSNTGSVSNLKQSADALNSKYEQMVQLLTQLNSNFTKDMKNVANTLKQATSGGGMGTAAGKATYVKDVGLNNMMLKVLECVCAGKIDKKEALTIKALKKLNKEERKNLAKMHLQVAAQASRAASTTAAAATAGGGGGGEGGAVSSEEEKSLLERIKEIRNVALSTIIKITSSISDMMFGVNEKGSLSQLLTQGMVQDEVRMQRELRQTAYMVAGVTGEMQGLQIAYADVGKAFEETGVNRTKYLEEYNKNFQAGIRDAKVLRGVTRQTLAAEQLTGMAAGDLTEKFREMNLAYKLNLAQTGAISRNIVEVARNTGLTGTHLKKAIDASDNFMKNMNKAATFTASAAKNIMTIVANAQKLGVEGKTGELLESITSTTTLINKADAKTKAFLYNAAGVMGKTQQLQMGVLARSRKGMAELATGMEKVLQGFGIRSLEEIENLTDPEKMRLNLQLEASFGMELGEITRVVEAFKESGKGLPEQLDKINQKRKQNLNMEEKAALLEEERAAKTSAGLSILTGLNEAAKGAKTMDDAFAKFSRRQGEFADDLKAMGGDFSNLTGGVKFALTDAIKNVNEGLQKSGKEPIKIDAAEIEAAMRDKEALKMVTERIEAANKKLMVAQKGATDPATKTAQTLESYNEYFRNDFVAPLFGGMTKLIGATTAIGIAITLLGAQFATSALLNYNKLTSGFDALKKLAGSTATSAAGSAAGAAAGAAASGGGAAAAGAAGAAQSKAFALSWGQMAGHLKTLGIGLVGTVAGIAMLGIAIVAIGAVAAATKKALSVDPLELAKDVSKVFIAAAIIGGEMALAFFALQAADKASGGFAKIFNPAVAQQLGLAAAGILVMTIAMMALARAILFIGDLLSYGIDADEALHIAFTVSSILWGANAIMLAVAAGTAIMLGVGAMLFALSAGGIAGWALALAGIGALALVGLAMVGIMAGLKFFMDKIAESAGEDFQAKADKAIQVLNTLNSVLLRMVPLVGLIILAGVAAAVITSMLPLATMNAVFIGIVGAAIAAGLFYPIVQGLMWIAQGVINAAAAVPEYDKKFLDATVQKLTNLMDAVTSVLLKLAPLFLTILSVGALIGAAIAFGGIAFGAAFLAAALVFAAALPIIAKGLIAISKSIIEVANSELSQYKVEKSMGDLLFSKLDSMSYVIIQLGLGYGLVSAAAAMTASIFAISAAAMLIAGKSLLLTIAASAVLIGAMILLDYAFWGYDLKQFSDLATKIILFSSALLALSTALKILSLYGAVSLGSFLGLVLYAAYLTSALKPISDILQSYYKIGIMIYQTSVLLPLQKVIKGIKEISQFGDNLGSFLSIMARMRLMGKVGGFVKNMLPKKSVSQQLKEHLWEIKEIVDTVMSAGLDRGKLESSNAVFKIIAEFSKNFGSTMREMGSVITVLDPKTFFGYNKEIFDAKAMNSNLDKIFTFINSIISKGSEQAKSMDIPGMNKTIANMNLISNLMSAFASTITSLGKSLDTLYEAQHSGGWGGWFTTDKFAIFSEEVSDGATKTTKFNKTMKDLLTALANLAKDMDTALGPIPNDMSGAVMKLETVSPVLGKVGDLISTTGTNMSQMFAKGGYLWGSDGPGEYLRKNEGTIKDGIQSIFRITSEMLTSIAANIKIGDGASAAGNLAGMNVVFAVLNPALSEMSGHIKEFSRIIQEDMSFLVGGKTIFGKEDWSAYNKVFTAMTDGMKSLGDILHGLTSSLASGVGTLDTGSLKKSAEVLKVVTDVLYYVSTSLNNLNIVNQLFKKDLSFLTTGDTKQIDVIAQGSGTFLKSISGMLTQIDSAMGNLDAGQLQSISPRLQAVAGIMEPLTTTLESFAKSMTPLTQSTWMGMGSSIADQIKDSSSSIDGSLKAVVSLVNTVVDGVKTMPDAKGFEDVAKKMEAMGKVVENLAPIMENLSKSLTTLTSKDGLGTSLQDHVAKLMNNFGKQNPIKNVFQVIKDKIVLPLNKLGLDPSDVTDAAEIMTGMANILEGMEKAIRVINVSLAGLVDVGQPNESQMQYAADMLYKYGNTMHYVLWALGTFVGTLLKVGDPGDVKDAGEILTGIAAIMTALAGDGGGSKGLILTVNTSLAKLVQASNEKNVPKNQVEKAAENLKSFTDGFRKLLPNMAYLVNSVNYAIDDPDAVTQAATTLKGVGEIMNVLPGILTNINEKLPGMVQSMSRLQGYQMPAMKTNTGFLDALTMIGGFVDDIMAADISTLASNVTAATGDLTKLDQALIELANVMGSIGGSMQKIASLGAKGLSVSTSATVSTAAGAVAPGGSVASQVAMQTTSGDFGPDMTAMTEATVQNQNLYQTMIDLLSTIAGGVTSTGGGGMVSQAIDTAKNWMNYTLPSSDTTQGPNYGGA